MLVGPLVLLGQPLLDAQDAHTPRRPPNDAASASEGRRRRMVDAAVSGGAGGGGAAGGGPLPHLFAQRVNVTLVKLKTILKI